MHTNKNSFILALTDDETLHSLLTKTSHYPAEILSNQLKQCFEVKSARTMVKVNAPEYRNKLFEITEIKFNLDLTEFINKRVSISCNFTLAMNSQELFLINENCIIKANFRKCFSNRLINYLNHNLEKYEFWIKTFEINLQFQIFKNTVLKLIRVLTGQLNLYERASIKRRFYKVIYFLLIMIRFRNCAQKFRYYQLTETQFRELLVYENDFLERFVRRKQFELVTDNFTKTKVIEIVEHFKKNDLNEIWKKNGEDATDLLFSDELRWLDLKFWNNGNGHFFANIVYGFRRHMLPYEHEIDSTKYFFPYLSMAYFDRKERMEDTEIKDLLLQSPISLRGKKITGGRHRVFAMIGRLARGERYIPFLVDRCL